MSIQNVKTDQVKIVCCSNLNSIARFATAEARDYGDQNFVCPSVRRTDACFVTERWNLLLTFISDTMPASYLSDVLLRHSMQHYSVEMFSRALATIEFIMVQCRLLSIAELSLSCSDLA